MVENTINAASNATFANDLISKALAEPEVQIEPAKITPPSDNFVTLPGGYVTPTGEVIKVAEVRELNGRDEEAIGKATNTGRLFAMLINRAVVSVGNVKATDTILDNMLAGDRDALLLGIYKATFGNEAVVPSWCPGCKEFKSTSIDVDKDIKIRSLIDPINDRVFTVKGKTNEFLVALPTGVTQRELSVETDKTIAELNTILLENTVLEINGISVLSKSQVQNLGIVDRKLIIVEIVSKSPGPKFEEMTIDCPDCEGKVVVPISLGALFQL